MTKFKLLLLPPKAQKNVLRTMRYVEVIGFSLCSKLTKRLITSLKYAAQNVEVLFIEKFKLYIYFKRCLLDIMSLYETPHVMIISESGWNDGEFQKENFALNDWITHFTTIFHIKVVQSVSILRNQIPVEYVRNAIGRVKFMTLRIIISTHEHTEKLVKRLVPRDDILKINRPFQSSSVVLLQNLKVLRVSNCQNWKLNDLFMLNAKYAYLMLVQMTSTDMNRFLKLWMRGSNPNLIFLESRAQAHNFVKHEVKKGIKGLEIPEETTRTFDVWVSSDVVRSEEVKGGFNIRRFDGTLGTLYFMSNFRLSFVVWQ